MIDMNTATLKLDSISNILSSHDIALIKSIPLYNTHDHDSLYWPLNNDSVYTVKSGYRWALSQKRVSMTTTISSSHLIDKKVWKILWGIKEIPKVLNFIWRALNNALPSIFNLFPRHLHVNPICPFYKDQFALCSTKISFLASSSMASY